MNTKSRKSLQKENPHILAVFHSVHPFRSVEGFRTGKRRQSFLRSYRLNLEQYKQRVLVTMKKLASIKNFQPHEEQMLSTCN